MTSHENAEPPAATPKAPGSAGSSGLFWAAGVALLLAAWIYGPLFFPSELPSALNEMSAEGDQFFFEVNEAAGAPVLILALWLFYRRSHLHDELFGPGHPLAAATVWLATAAIYAWGVYTAAVDLQLLTVIGLLFGALLMWGGGGAVRAYWLPVLFIGFALPISPVLISAIIWPVQLATAKFAGFLLNAIGVQSLVQGDQILRPENRFIVIETCSGLRSVVTLTMLTILMIDLFERRGRHALLLMLIAPVVALFTNGIRVVTLVLNPHSDVASIHSLQGIVMLLVGLTLIYFIDSLFARGLGSDEAGAASLDYGHARTPVAMTRGRLMALACPALMLLLMLGLRTAIEPFDATRPLAKPVDAQVAAVLGDWPSKRTSPNYKYRGGIHFRSWSRRRIGVDGRAVDLLVGLANPTNRKLTMYSDRFAQPDSGFERVEESEEPLVAGAPEARRVIFQRGPHRMLSYSWYEPDPSFAEEFVRHALALDRSPAARERTAVAVRLSTRLSPREPEEAAEARLAKVYERVQPVVEALGASPSGKS